MCCAIPISIKLLDVFGLVNKSEEPPPPLPPKEVILVLLFSFLNKQNNTSNAAAAAAVPLFQSKRNQNSIQSNSHGYFHNG